MDIPQPTPGFDIELDLFMCPRPAWCENLHETLEIVAKNS
jgi:hypothetical protein